MDLDRPRGLSGPGGPQGIGINLAPLVGHSAIRGAVVGFDDRPADPDELHRMGRLLQETLEQGAFGFSTGLTLPPSAYGDTAEIVALARTLAGYPGTVLHQSYSRLGGLSCARRRGGSRYRPSGRGPGPGLAHVDQRPEALGRSGQRDRGVRARRGVGSRCYLRRVPLCSLEQRVQPGAFRPGLSRAAWTRSRRACATPRARAHPGCHAGRGIVPRLAVALGPASS